jgi:ATP-dependent RNA helicase DDX1
MDQAIIFCRTKVDCDNVEQYLLELGGGARAMVNGYSVSAMLKNKKRERGFRSHSLCLYR